MPSPIAKNPALELVTRLLDVQQAAIAKVMEYLNDSLTRRLSADDGDHWVFRHPTVTDVPIDLMALDWDAASITAKSPAPIDLR